MSSSTLQSLLPIDGLAPALARVEQELRHVATSATALQPHLDQVINRGGKRLRPALLLAISLSLGHELSETAIQAATAIELVHLASVVHDDIIDQADTRGGTAALQHDAGMAQALVAGDYLLAQACRYGAMVSTDTADVVTSAISQLCEGESIELSSRFNLDRGEADVLAAIDGKTGALFGAACQLGAKLGGVSPAEIKQWVAYGQAFGRAFQIIDDLLDLLSTEQLAGKPVGNDAPQGTYTLPVVYGLTRTDKQSLKPLLQDKASSTKLVDTLLANGAIQQTIAAAKQQLRVAGQAINQHHHDSFQIFLEHYWDFAVNKLIQPNYRHLFDV